MAAAEWSRWLLLWSSRLLESQHDHCGNWRWASGTLSYNMNLFKFSRKRCLLKVAFSMSSIWSAFDLFLCLCFGVQVEKKESNEEQDDIESNLLLPAGVALRSAVLSLKVYRAEDMPQSELCSTEHCYCVVQSGFVIMLFTFSPFVQWTMLLHRPSRTCLEERVTRKTSWIHFWKLVLLAKR